MYWNERTKRWVQRRPRKRTYRLRLYRDTNPPGGARDQLIEAIDKLLDEAQSPLDDDAPEHSLS